MINEHQKEVLRNAYKAPFSVYVPESSNGYIFVVDAAGERVCSFHGGGTAAIVSAASIAKLLNEAVEEKHEVEDNSV